MLVVAMVAMMMLILLQILMMMLMMALVVEVEAGDKGVCKQLILRCQRRPG